MDHKNKNFRAGDLITILESVGYKEAKDSEKFQPGTFHMDKDKTEFKIIWTSAPNRYNGQITRDSFMWFDSDGNLISGVK